LATATACPSARDAANQGGPKQRPKQHTDDDGADGDQADGGVARHGGVIVALGLVELELHQRVNVFVHRLIQRAHCRHHQLGGLGQVVGAQGGDGRAQALLHELATVLGKGLGDAGFLRLAGGGHVNVPDFADAGNVGLHFGRAGRDGVGVGRDQRRGQGQPVAQQQFLDFGHLPGRHQALFIGRTQRLVGLDDAKQADAANGDQQSGQDADQNGQACGNFHVIQVMSPVNE